jgi:hypothetical protein
MAGLFVTLQGNRPDKNEANPKAHRVALQSSHIFLCSSAYFRLLNTRSPIPTTHNLLLSRHLLHSSAAESCNAPFRSLQRPPNAAPKPHQCDIKAIWYASGRHPIATHKSPQSHHKAILMRPSSHPKATLEPTQRPVNHRNHILPGLC